MPARSLLNLLTDRLWGLPVLSLTLTERCNSRCRTCDYWRTGERGLDFARIEQIARELPRLGTRLVVLTGGEPLLYPRWREVARLMREGGARVALLTHGLLLARHADDAAALFGEAYISLDGASPATYQAIRGLDGLKGVEAGARAMVARGVRATLRCTVQRANFRELPALIDLARAWGVAQISFLAVDVRSTDAFGRLGPPALEPTADGFEMALRPDDLPEFAAVLDRVEREYAGDFASGLIAESPAKLRRLHDYFTALQGLGPSPPVACNAPRVSAVVAADGGVQPCYFLPATGALGDDGLLAALNQPAGRALRIAVRTGARPECERCVCSLKMPWTAVVH